MGMKCHLIIVRDKKRKLLASHLRKKTCQVHFSRKLTAEEFPFKLILFIYICKFLLPGVLHQ